MPSDFRNRWVLRYTSWTHHDHTISRHEPKSSVYVINHNDLLFLPRRASRRLGEGDHDERRRVKDVNGANLGDE